MRRLITLMLIPVVALWFSPPAMAQESPPDLPEDASTIDVGDHVDALNESESDLMTGSVEEEQELLEKLDGAIELNDGYITFDEDQAREAGVEEAHIEEFATTYDSANQSLEESGALADCQGERFFKQHSWKTYTVALNSCDVETISFLMKVGGFPVTVAAAIPGPSYVTIPIAWAIIGAGVGWLEYIHEGCGIILFYSYPAFGGGGQNC